MRAGLCAALLCASYAIGEAASKPTAKTYYEEFLKNQTEVADMPVYFFDAAASAECSACGKEFTLREAADDGRLAIVFMESEMFEGETPWPTIPFDPKSENYETTAGSQAALLGHYTNQTACAGLPAEGHSADDVAIEGMLSFNKADPGPIAEGSLCGSKGTIVQSLAYLNNWHDGDTVDEADKCFSLLTNEMAHMANATKDRYVKWLDANNVAFDFERIATPTLIVINVSNPEHQGVFRSNRYSSDDADKPTLSTACRKGAHFSVVGGEGKADDKKDLSTAAIAAIATGAAVVAAAIGYVIYTHMSSGAGVFASSLQ